MPTYQYSCTECGHFFEQFQRFSDDSLKVCPECQGQLRKIFNAVGVVFKGSGFYRTDSRSTSTATDAAKEPAASGAAQSAGGSGSNGSSTSSTSTSSTSTSSTSASSSGSTSGSAA